MKLGAVVGFNGEALRGLEMKMSRRAGEIRSLGLSAKIGRGGTLTGELRGRPGGRQVVDLETSDAGALFRFTDVYSRMNGGQMTTLMDAPSANNPTQTRHRQRQEFLPSTTSRSSNAPWRTASRAAAQQHWISRA